MKNYRPLSIAWWNGVIRPGDHVPRRICFITQQGRQSRIGQDRRHSGGVSVHGNALLDESDAVAVIGPGLIMSIVKGLYGRAVRLLPPVNHHRMRALMQIGVDQV